MASSSCALSNGFCRITASGGKRYCAIAALAEILDASREEGGNVEDAYVLRRICIAPTDIEARALMP
ncbi:MAG: hypothetical protein QOI24_2646 [Acidobacteriota bacterium]|nr:hypothetical protein [Acidobacteriota bacterium]